MSPKMKKFFSYYRPYLRIFVLDMACAFTASGINLAFPLIVRYIATDLPGRRHRRPFRHLSWLLLSWSQ